MRINDSNLKSRNLTLELTLDCGVAEMSDPSAPPNLEELAEQVGDVSPDELASVATSIGARLTAISGRAASVRGGKAPRRGGFSGASNQIADRGQNQKTSSTTIPVKISQSKKGKKVIFPISRTQESALRSLVVSNPENEVPPPEPVDPDIEEKLDSLSIVSSNLEDEVLVLKAKVSDLEALQQAVQTDNEALQSVVTKLTKEMNTLLAVVNKGNIGKVREGSKSAEIMSTSDDKTHKASSSSATTRPRNIIRAPSPDQQEQKIVGVVSGKSRKKFLG